MWNIQNLWYAPILKGLVVYFVLFLVVKFLKKKKLGDLSPIEFSIFLTIAGTVITLAIGEDKGVLSGVIFISTLCILNFMTHELAFRYRWFEELIEGQPRVVILNGKIHKNVLKREKITNAELFEALREHEIMNPDEVKCAILEVDGKISVTKYVH